MKRRWILPLAMGIAMSGSAVPEVQRSPEAAVGTTVEVATASHRSLDEAPIPVDFVDPGLEGLYAELRAEQEARKPRLCRAPRGPRARVEAFVPYAPYAARETPANPSAFNLRQIVVKLVEGSSVRLRDGRLRPVDEPDAVETRERLARSGLEHADVERDLAALTESVESVGAVVGRAAPGVDEADLARLRRCAETRSRQELPDLDLFYYVHLPKGDGETAEKLLERLRRLRSVELAYFQPIPFDAADIPPPTTIDVTPAQGYFRPAPDGIDVDFARRFRAGRGNAVRIADIESGWHLNHEDLPRTGFGFGVNWVDSHGTAVLGELAAEENGFGADGIAPNAVIGTSSVTNLDSNIFFYSVGNALLVSARALRVGDVALIEQQFQHPDVGFICNPATDPCPEGCARPPWVAVEEFGYEHAAISAVTRAGLIVVEAAGNGRMLVVPASGRDSGAIVVGASNGALQPTCWSNFGPRVDVHGWGLLIGTTGYGGVPLGAPDPALRANGGDPDQWYTTTFNGTSGASPIVAGAAAIVQATRAEAGLPPLDSFGLRALLVSTGTPQTAGSAPNIGPLPDLRRAIASYRPDTARFVGQSNAPGVVAPGSTFARSATFVNSGGSAWSGAHTMSVAPSARTGLQEFRAPGFALGSAGGEILHGDQVTRGFAITAPTEAGTYDLAIVLRNGAGQVMASSPTEQVVVAVPGTAFDDAEVRIVSAPGSLATGGGDRVEVEVRNTGSTSWSDPRYALRLGRGLRVSLPQPTVTLPGPVAPGGVLTLSFWVGCSGPGQGWFSAQMAGQAGSFGDQAARTVICR